MFIGVDIGGTKIAVSKGEHGEVLEKKVFLTETSPSWEDAVEKIIDAASPFCMEAKAIGISAGGPLDSRRGLILSPPNLPSWDNVPIVKILTERLNRPSFLLNDADAGALVEYRYGKGKEYENIVFCTFGTGMGAGLIINGKLWRGRNDGAGEIGHVRLTEHGPSGYGKIGSVEGWASGSGISHLTDIIASSYLQKGIEIPWFKRGQTTAKTVIENAYKEDVAALEIIKECAKHLGSSLSIIMDMINPDAIILGSLFVRAEKLLRPEMEKVIEKETLKRNICPVFPAQNGENIGDIAALSIAEEGYNGNL